MRWPPVRLRSYIERIVKTVGAIGANIFPYWGGAASSTAGAAQGQAKALLAVLTPFGVKGVIITEEGWPSCNSPNQNPTDINKEIDYYTSWKNRQNPVFDSYYFMAYNMSDACEAEPMSDADNHFGLCNASGKTKNTGLIECPAVTRPRR